MKQLRLLNYLFAACIFFYSCDSSTDNLPLGEFEKGLLIINEGNFSDRDGDISHYNFNTDETKHNIFELVNNRPFAGIIQDVVEDGDRLYIVSNTGKVEVVNAHTFESIGSTEDAQLVQPRSAIAFGNKLYIADYGPYDENWANTESFIAIVDNLTGGTISKKVSVSDRPESLYISNNNLLIACAAAKKIDIMPIGIDTVNNSIDIEGTPVRFMDFEGKLLLFARNSATVFLHEIDQTNYSIVNTTEINLTNPTSRLTPGENGEGFIITSTGWPDYNDAVAKVSLRNGEIINGQFYEGSGLYGIAYDAKEKQIYVTDNNAFQGNGTVTVLDQNGTTVKTIQAGRGPSGFIFRR